ncbi:MAG TPA: hypothetical protein VE175_08580, partial [Woeseiaceae bacterium]|nr:hypothetical protein [Woeseiaceae bacterium]
MKSIGRKRSRRAFNPIGLLAGLALLTGVAAAKSPAASELDLEPSLRSAALVIAVRVDDVKPVQVVYGGKSARTLDQYTFTPVRVLKGVYPRPELLLTSADLQPYAFEYDLADMQSGQYRLLLLGRSNIGYYGIHPGSSSEQSFPELTGSTDPLLAAIDVLLELEEEPDRLTIVSRLSRELHNAEARGAVVLLEALDGRRYVAAQQEAVFEAVARHLASEDPIVRETAARVLGHLFDADCLTHEAAREAAVGALTSMLLKPELRLRARVAALHALASATGAVRENEDAVRLVQLSTPYDTLAERSGRLGVLGRLQEHRRDAVTRALSELLAGLPLDAPDYLQRSAAEAWARMAAAEGAEALVARLRRKQTAGLDGVAEISAFRLILPDVADPWPMQEALLETGLTTPERRAFVKASKDSPSPQLASALADMLDPRQPELRRGAANLLMAIDTRAAARALKSHLAEEPGLEYKLKLAGFLGRHGFDDGYAYALEHMSDPRYLEAAVKAIAAIAKPGSTNQLLEIYRTSNDLAWKRAAVRALGLLRYQPFSNELTDLTRDLEHPLAAAALQARADLGDEPVAELLPAALASRSESVVVAAARSAGTLLSQAGAREARAKEILAALRTLALDADAAQSARHHALEALISAEDRQLDRVL